MSASRLRNHTRLSVSTHGCIFQPARQSQSYLRSGLLSRQARASSTASLPRIAQPSLWQAVIPKFLRQPRTSDSSKKSPRSKEWDPATFFIAIFLLIGSNSIQLIALKNSFANFNRTTDSKIALLQETIERVRKGEDVDVERILGSGDPEEEREWEAVIKEIQAEDQRLKSKGKKDDKKASPNNLQNGSIANLTPPRSSEVRSEITPGKDRSHSGDRQEGRDKSSRSAPRTFY